MAATHKAAGCAQFYFEGVNLDQILSFASDFFEEFG
jgi:hypothetical protein